MVSHAFAIAAATISALMFALAMRDGRRPARRAVLALDLDETLVHLDDQRRLWVRPGAPDFVARMARLFDEVVLFTAALPVHADSALKALRELDHERKDRFGRRLYRADCTVGAGGVLHKDLRKLGAGEGARVWLVDNTPTTYAMQPHLGVAIKSYFGGHNVADRELARVERELIARFKASC
jgi:TFIIF-interacting CTD phosphatase-like protein